MLITDAKVQAKSEAIMFAKGATIHALIEKAMTALDFDTLFDAAEGVSQAITPYLPCRDGCSHCCYMGVLISDIEADAISRFTGRAKARKGDVNLDALSSCADRYATVPCTFLSEGKCSIYPVRPIACRTHHNLNDDASNCIILPNLENMETTPSINLMLFSFKAVDLAMKEGKGFADIREFFP